MVLSLKIRFFYAGSVGGVTGPSFNPNINRPEDTQSYSKVQNNVNLPSNKESTINSIRDAEQKNNSVESKIGDMQSRVGELNTNVQQFSDVVSSKAAANIRSEDINNKLMPIAKDIYNSSVTASTIHGFKASKPDLAKNGMEKVLNYINSAQANLQKSATESIKAKNPSLSDMMKISTHMNQANSQMYVIVGVARQLVEGINKLSNAQI